MKITVDMDPKDVWRIQSAASRLGVTPGEVLRAELANRRTRRDARESVRAAVNAGRCDADIAAEMRCTPGWVAVTRRGLGLKANPRYTKQESRKA